MNYSNQEMVDNIIETHNTSVTFDMERGESRVLNDVTMEIRREEILGIVGESGSGKSMFASALMDAVVEPGILSGEITYYPEQGKSIDLLNLSETELRSLRWEEISMVFQGAMSSFNPTMSIQDHFVETIQAHDYEVEESMNHARELLSDLYLEPERILDSYPHELSGGMSQRALIALSLVLEPNVIIMDEPTAALDLLMQRSILGLLEDLQGKYDLTVVFITHDLPLVAGLSDRLAVLYAFEFVEIGPAEQVITNPTHPYTRALLRAVPNLEDSLQMMDSIEGSSPDPVNVPAGCSYHPRCPLATDECRETAPPFHHVDDGHSTACFHWEQTSSSIPLENDGTKNERNIEGTQSNKAVVSLQELNVHFEQSTGLLDIFSDPKTVYAVNDVDLEIYENDVVALVGESGCGKTTLGKTAIGLQRPTSGNVTFREQNVWGARDKNGPIDIPFEEIRRSLQIIHQDPGSSLNSNKTVKHSLSKPLKKWQPDLTRADRQERIHRVLETVGMTPPEDYANRYPHQLSGGEQQRVVLIRALLMNPDLILADEAVSALDVSLRVEMMDLMLELQELINTSYLFISHNLANARYLAENVGGRIGVMYLGHIVEIGPADEIIQNPKHPYTKVLKWSTAELEAEESIEEPPIRGIDIPDPVDPPTGCPFHTRCPEARDVCTQEMPSLMTQDGIEKPSTEHGIHSVAACFRQDPNHVYWESEPLDSMIGIEESITEQNQSADD